MSQNLHIPVAEAQRIATTYGKSQVVILTTDVHHQYCTTFGQSPTDKVQAARLGEFLSVQMGQAPKPKDFSEDFRRDFDAANYKAARDLLHNALTVMNAHAVGHKTQAAIETFLANTNPKIRGNYRN